MRAIRRLLFLLMCIAPCWGLAVLLTGGVGGRLFGANIASRDPDRPLILGAVALAAYVWRFRRNAADDAVWIGRLGRKLLAPLAIALCIATFALGVAWGTFAASGSDSYGYVSQAELWVRGQLRVPQLWTSDLPWPAVTLTFAPLGYRPATVPHTIVPAYPSGLPLLMAVARFIAGPTGPFYVVPLLGALAVWLTYRLGQDWTNDRATGVLAALLLTVSPIFLYQLMWPMTDVPVAAFWAAAFLAACHSRGPRPLAAGLAAGAAVLIRPNLVLMAVGLPVAWLWPAALRRTAVVNVGWYLLGLAPCVAVVAAIQLYLYGSPLTSGYGRLSELYSTQNVLSNLGRYSTWLIETQTPLVGLSLVALAMKRTLREDDADRISRRAGFCAVTVLIAVSYLTFAVFDDWSSLRFFLPIFPPMLTLAAAASVWLVNKIWRPLRVPLVLLIVIPFAAHEVRLAADRAVFKVKTLEHRYIESARQVASVTPPSAVILSVQHSGSVRYYAARQTLRYDELSPEWLDRAVAALKDRGSRCYVLLDDWEEPGFRERFSAFTRLGRLDWRPIAEVAGPVHVRLFDLEAQNPTTPRSLER